MNPELRRNGWESDPYLGAFRGNGRRERQRERVLAQFGDEGDTFKGKFNFYCLTSAFSFSCGNCLPGIAKEAGVKIIGETSGGGTSPVGVYFDGLGTFFNLSNHYDMCYKDGGKFVHNDAGIPLDHPFPFNEGNWYDANAVNTFIKGL